MKRYKIKRTTITCRCNAYKFPHRWQGGKCKVEKPVAFSDVGYAEDDYQAIEKSYRELLESKDSLY